MVFLWIYGIYEAYDISLGIRFSWEYGISLGIYFMRRMYFSGYTVFHGHMIFLWVYGISWEYDISLDIMYFIEYMSMKCR